MSVVKIGFANLDEKNPFTVAVRQHLEALAAHDPEIELFVRDNDLNTSRAAANAAEFAALGVHVAIMFHVDERMNNQVVQPLRRAHIPIISIDFPIQLTTFLGINAIEAGEQVGSALAEWAEAHWQGYADRLLVMTETRSLEIFHRRYDAAIQLLRARLNLLKEQIVEVDNGGNAEATFERVTQMMKNWGGFQHILIICQNDKIAVGALEAARALGREAHVAVGSYDGTEVALAEFAKPDSRLIVSPSFRPDAYAEMLISLCKRLAAGERVPFENLVSPLRLTRDSH